MTGPARNEVTITLAGEERTLRASFTAIAAIEKALGKSMMAVINKVASGDLAVTEAAVIIFHGLRGFDDTRLTYEQVGEAVVTAGVTKVSLPVVEFVNIALSGVEVGKPEEPVAAL